MVDVLRPGEKLFANNSDSRTSNNGRFNLVMQQDGNLVLYRDGGNAIWASNTDGTAVDFCVMQSDGNLVLYGFSNNAVWASGTNGQNDSFLVVQDDGNAVIYRPNFPVWATGTNQ